MNYIWFNKDKSIKKFNIAYFIEESKNVDELYIFTDDPNMDRLNCYVRFKRADTLVLGDFDTEYGSYEIDGEERYGWKLTINTNVLKVAGQLGISVIFRTTMNGREQDYAQCYVTTIVLKSVAFATDLEQMLQEFRAELQPKLTAGDNILINGTVISVKLANVLANTQEIPSCALVKRYIDESNSEFFEGLDAVLDEINGDVTVLKLETPVIYLENGILTFNAIPRATSYKLYVDGDYEAEVTESPINLSTYITSTGTYSVQLKAVAYGYTDSDLSNAVEYVKLTPTPQLNAPSNLTVTTDHQLSWVLSWDAPSNAGSANVIYKVYVDGELFYTTNGTSYSFGGELSDGTYSFQVFASADGFIDSPGSQTLTYTKQTIFAEYSLSFDINGATGTTPTSRSYRENVVVSLDQFTSEGFSKENYYFVGWNENSSATVAQASVTMDSNKKVYAIWNILPKLDTPSNLAINGTQFQWGAVSNAVSYTVVMNDVVIGTTTSTFFNFNSYVTNPGTYYFQVKASASGYRDSDLTAKSESLKYIKSLPKISAPVISISDGVVSWSPVYITIDGQTYTAYYRVYSDGVALSQTMASTSYSLVGAFNQSGTYAITVKCVGLNGIYQESDASNSVNYSVTVSTTYTVNFSRTDSNNGQTLGIVVSYSGGTIDLSGDDDSASIELNATGVTFTITYYGIAYGGLPIPEGEQFSTHTASLGAIHGIDNFTPTTWSDTKSHDVTITKTITVNGASNILLSNQGYL